MKKNRVLSVLVVINCMSISCMSLLTGCGMKMKTPEDVIDKCVEVESDSYHVDIEMDMNVKMSAMGLSFDIPIDFSGDMDVVKKIGSHSKIKMAVDVMDETMDVNMESYYDEDEKVTYSTEDGDLWTMTDTDDTNSLGDMEIDSKYFKNAEMEKDKKSGNYIITADFTDVAKIMNLDGLLRSMDLSDIGINVDDMLNSIEDCDTVWVFDGKTCMLKSFTLDDFEAATSVEDGDMTFNMSMTLEYSDYDKIDEENVTVPKTVKKNATKESSVDNDCFGIFNNDEDFEDDIDFEEDKDLDEEFETSKKSNESEEETKSVTKQETKPNSASGVTKTGDFFYGAVNGIALTNKSNNWSNTFALDGWTFDEDTEGDYSFLSAENEKYPYAALYIYPIGDTNASISNIMENGFCGYDIELAYEDNKPSNLTWGDGSITIGSSRDDIEAFYGEPDNVYDGSNYTSISYLPNHNDELVFYIYEDGLQKVEFIQYTD